MNSLLKCGSTSSLIVSSNLLKRNTLSSSLGKRFLSDSSKSSTNSSSSSSIPKQLTDPKFIGIAAAGFATLLLLGSGSSSGSTKAVAHVDHKPTEKTQEQEEIASIISSLKEEINKTKEYVDATNAKEQELIAKAKLDSEKQEALLKEIIGRIQKIEDQVVIDEATRLNRAFVFLKPHAVNDKVDALLKSKFKSAGVSIVSEGNISAKTIDEKQLIDTHYYAIASKAVLISPKDLDLTAKAKEEFLKISNGLSWEEALSKGYVYSAKEACEKLGVDGDQLEKLWAPVKSKKALVKFGGGFYCGRMVDEDKEKDIPPMFVINGFYMAMRGKYCVEPASIHYYTVEWDPRNMSWKEFRSNLLGSTDPAEAALGSVRREIYESWESLGLSAKPDTGDNGVHASASPFEAAAERINWTGEKLENDVFARAMLYSGIPEPILRKWLVDAQVSLNNGKKSSIFDMLEDSDASECLKKLSEVKKN